MDITFSPLRDTREVERVGTAVTDRIAIGALTNPYRETPQALERASSVN